MAGPPLSERLISPGSPLAVSAVDAFLPTVPARVSANLEHHLNCLESSQSVREPNISAFRYALLSAEAHRIRPALSYVTALACGMEPREVDMYAMAMEMYHNMSLMLDDLPTQDDSDERRHQPPLHVAFNSVALAENTAPLMAIRAARLVERTDLGHGLNGALSEYVAEALGRLDEGQAKDLAIKGKSDDEVTLEELDEIAELKTAAAIEMCIAGVAMISRQPRRVIERLKEYSKYYGIAFQIQDDLIDSLRGPSGSGKTHNLDKKNRKPTHASKLGRAGAQARARENTDRAAAVAVEHLAGTLDTTGFEQITEHIADPGNHR